MDTLELVARRLDEIEKHLHPFPDIDFPFTFNTSKPYIMDYQNRSRVYVWSPVSFALSIDEYGFVPVPAYSWVNLNIPEGVRITSLSGSVQVLLRFTNHSLPTGGGVNNIQAAVLGGQAFRAMTGIISTGAGSNNFIGIQLPIPAIAKSVIVTAALVMLQNVSGELRLYTSGTSAAADAGLTGTAPTVFNMAPASSVTSLLTPLVSPANTTETSGFPGTLTMIDAGIANATTNFFKTTNDWLYFPKGVTGTVAIYAKIPTTGNSASLAFEWVEL